MEVIGHANLLKKGYFVMALCLSQTLSVMSGHSNRFLLDTSMPHSPERKKKKFFFFSIIYDNFDKVNYQHSRHIVVVMFGSPCICCLLEKCFDHCVRSFQGPPRSKIQV